METVLYFLPCLYAFVACLGFSMLFNIHGFGMVICSAGGSVAWCAYLLAGPISGHNDIVQAFIAALVLSIYAEAMARMRKCPVTGYMIVAFLPLVPGAGIYQTMEYCISGEGALFISEGLHTLGVAGALAVGVLVVSSLVRMYTTFRRKRLQA